MTSAIFNKDYNSLTFRRDLLAALTVVVLLIPQGMAYAVLAGFPPVYGLYAGIVPLLIYPFFGTSPFLSVGPVAIVSILLVSGLCQFAEPMSLEFIQLAVIVTLMSGIMQCLFSVFKLGYLVNFLSHPVIGGFTSAAAFIIIISQLKYLLGIEVERSNSALLQLKNIFSQIAQTNIWALGVGVVSIFLLLLSKKFKSKIPIAFNLIVLTSLVAYIFNLDTYIQTVGEVPSGLPAFHIPEFLTGNILVQLLPLSFVIALISFVESMAIVKTLGAKHGQYSINADKELMGLGLSKIVGSFFQGFATSGSFTRSAISEAAGARTRWSSIYAAIIIGLTLIFLTSTFYYIPYPVLAALIIMAVLKLIDYKLARQLWKTDRNDFWVMMCTFFVTIIFGVQGGIASGIILSLLIILKKVSRPHVAVLGKIDDSGIYKNVDRWDEAEVNDDVLIVRYDDSVFFGNAEHFYHTIIEELNKKPSTKIMILDSSSISNIDSTGVMQLKILLEFLQKKNVEFYLSGPKGPLRDRLRKEGIFDLIGKDNLHLTIEKTMRAIQKPTLNIVP